MRTGANKIVEIINKFSEFDQNPSENTFLDIRTNFNELKVRKESIEHLHEMMRRHISILTTKHLTHVLLALTEECFKNNLEQAAIECRDAIEIDKDSPYAWLILKDLYVEKLIKSESATELNEKSKDHFQCALNCFANLLRINEKREKTWADLRYFILLNKKIPVSLAQIPEELNSWQDKISFCLAKILQINPKNYIIWNSLGIFILENESITKLSTEHLPNLPQNWSSYHKYQEAAFCHTQSLLKNKNNGIAWNYLGSLIIKCHDLQIAFDGLPENWSLRTQIQKATYCALQAIQNNSENSIFWSNLAFFIQEENAIIDTFLGSPKNWLQLDQNEQATFCLKKAIKHTPSEKAKSQYRDRLNKIKESISATPADIKTHSAKVTKEDNRKNEANNEEPVKKFKKAIEKPKKPIKKIKDKTQQPPKRIKNSTAETKPYPSISSLLKVIEEEEYPLYIPERATNKRSNNDEDSAIPYKKGKFSFFEKSSISESNDTDILKSQDSPRCSP